MSNKEKYKGGRTTGCSDPIIKASIIVLIASILLSLYVFHMDTSHPQIADQPHHTSGNDGNLSMAERNRQHWNDFASKYTEHGWQRDMINNMTSFILNNINWLGVPFNSPASTFESSTSRNSIRVLDYACGPGTITNALADHATEYIGVDISEGMLDAYNTRFSKDSPPSQEFTARGVVGNLVEDEPPTHLSGPEFFGFDLAAVGAGFHHFDNVQLATTRLAERLKPGGVLMIIDFLAWQAEGDEHKHQIAHNGFTEERVKELFGKAGLVDVGIVVDDQQWKIKDWTRTGFMAKGSKPIEST